MRRVMLPLAMTAALAGPAGAAPTRGPDYSAARDLELAARAAEAAGDHAAAATALQAAYDITLGPSLLRRLAEAHAMAGRCDLALPRYRQFLAEGAPDADVTRVIEGRIAECTQVLADQAAIDAAAAEAEADAAAAAAAAAPPPPLTDRPAAWATTGAALGLAAVAGVLFISAHSADGDVEDLISLQPDRQPPTEGAAAARYDHLVAVGDRYAIAAWTTAGLASAATAAAVILFARSPAPAPERRAWLRPALGAEGAGVVGGVRF
ncbi:MAG: hypothetical protein R2939_13500 [Kofleriaceae bacterium]